MISQCAPAERYGISMRAYILLKFYDMATLLHNAPLVALYGFCAPRLCTACVGLSRQASTWLVKLSVACHITSRSTQKLTFLIYQELGIPRLQFIVSEIQGDRRKREI